MTALSDQFQPRKFGDQAAEIIRQLILAGEFRGGERLNEVALANKLGISRSPIREALNALAGEGLINFTPGRGAFVPEFDLDSVRQLGQARRALECEAVRLAAEDASDQALDQIVALLETTSGSIHEEPGQYPHDLDFHSLIVSICGNKVIEQMTSSVHRQLRLARLVSAQNPHRAREAYDEHLAILTAIRNRNATAASAAMYEHLTHAITSAQQAMTTTTTPNTQPVSLGRGR